MTIYTITLDNNITAHGSAEEANSIPEAEQFNTAKKLEKLATQWPTARLVEIWNSLPGATPVKKFTDRKKAVARIWAAIQTLGASVLPEVASDPEQPATEVSEGDVLNEAFISPSSEEVAAPSVEALNQDAPATPQTPDVAPAEPPSKKKATSAKREAKAPKKPQVAITREGSKTETILALMRRPGGASMQAIMDATNWQAHSVRGFVSGTLGKKMGLTVESVKGGDGQRSYSIKG